MSIRDKALACKPRRQTLAVPEWDCDVMVRGMTGEERDERDFHVIAIQEGKDKANVRARVVALCCLDPETGERVFTEADTTRLAQTDGKALDRIYDVVAELSGMGEKAKERAEKNSEKITD